ncbi:MAG: hypothetical protein R3313_02585 [Candidatus Saccharimonadales bacterium]|nr:hypothetical protein [Candidatus Saccharimonadales bacterium]
MTEDTTKKWRINRLSVLLGIGLVLSLITSATLYANSRSLERTVEDQYETIASKEATLAEKDQTIAAQERTNQELEGLVDIFTGQPPRINFIEYRSSNRSIAARSWAILEGFEEEGLQLSVNSDFSFPQLRVNVCDKLDSLVAIYSLESYGYGRDVLQAGHVYPDYPETYHQLILELDPGVTEAVIYAIAENVVAITAGADCMWHPEDAASPSSTLPPEEAAESVRQPRQWEPLGEHQHVFVDFSHEGWVDIGIEMCSEAAAQKMFGLLHEESPENVDFFGIDVDQEDIFFLSIDARFAGDDVVELLADLLIQGRAGLCNSGFSA